MSLAATLHQFIEQHNVLQEPTDALGAFFKEHPALYKVALLVNHLFRAFAMWGLGLFLPYGTLVNGVICFLGSLFYRLTVETHCAYKFALPAFAGSVALAIASRSLEELITGVAFASLSAFGLAFVSLIPLLLYTSYIVLTVSYDVEKE